MPTLLLPQLLETAAGYQGNSGDLEKQFAAAAANNLTTVRMFGFGVASGFQLQYSPGSYNENAFKAFDKVLHRACFVVPTLPAQHAYSRGHCSFCIHMQRSRGASVWRMLCTWPLHACMCACR